MENLDIVILPDGEPDFYSKAEDLLGKPKGNTRQNPEKNKRTKNPVEEKDLNANATNALKTLFTPHIREISSLKTKNGQEAIARN